jgi:cation transport regulator
MPPYEAISDLPKPVRETLPMEAQRIYREAFNSAWHRYSDPRRRRGASRDETAHRVAWSAVKHEYERNQERWVRKR